MRFASLLALTLGASMLAPPAVRAQMGAPSLPKVGALGIYVVDPGDTLYSIGLRYGLTINQLARLNGMSTYGMLLPGRGLWVPLEQAANAMADAPAQAPSGGHVEERPSGAGQYTVQPGDTLYAISRRFGAEVEALKRWNNLPFDGSIQAGQVLAVGANHDQAASDAASGAPHAAAGAGGTHSTYTVQPGDTLSSIASRFSTTAAGLRTQNGLIGDVVYAGQELTVPRPGSGVGGQGGAKSIEIDISEQRLYAWQGGALVWNFVASTGISGFPTRRGTFAVQSKVPNAWSSAWQLWMPSWLGIYWAGSTENGIHALPIINGQRIWAGYLGSPISYGCIVLGTNEAGLLYDWADIGTAVTIHD